MKSMMEVAAQVEAQRRMVQAEDGEDDDLDSSFGGNKGFKFSKRYKGELTEEDDLVMAMRDGMSGEDSPWPLTDLYRFLQAVRGEMPEEAYGCGTLTIKAVFVPDEPGDEE